MNTYLYLSRSALIMLIFYTTYYSLIELSLLNTLHKKYFDDGKNSYLLMD